MSYLNGSASWARGPKQPVSGETTVTIERQHGGFRVCAWTDTGEVAVERAVVHATSAREAEESAQRLFNLFDARHIERHR